jgi:peptidoglycan/xylan/chitin deacetylase (PgdA/CDA1 family)
MNELMKVLLVASVVAAFAIAGCGGASVKPFPVVNRAVLERQDPTWQRAWTEVAHSPRLPEPPLSLLRRGDADERVIALTFDDGPHGPRTQHLLQVLRQENVKATFFLVGKMAKKYPKLVKEIAADGHEIGNHTFSHATLTRITPEEAKADYEAASDTLQELTGKRPRLCRPPGGDLDDDVLQAAESLGMTTVLWTNDPGDYYRPGEETILDRTLAKASNGGIILLHDGIDQMIDVLPTIIETLRARGFKIVPAGELVKLKERRLATKHLRGRSAS